MADPDARGAATRVTSWASFAQAVSGFMRQREVHPADAVALLPYPALVPLARQAWSEQHALGFAPRFETALQWANRIGGPLPGPGDITFDAAYDRLTAAQLLAAAGMQQQPALVSRVVEYAYALAQPAAAAGPAGRLLWADKARRAMAWDAAGAPSVLDTALGRVALEWCVSSRHATDVLFESTLAGRRGCLFVLDGVSADPLADALLERWGEAALRLVWEVARPERPVPVASALDVGDEAQLTAALVLQHLERGTAPVALVANDRFLTRLVSAQLEQRGVKLRDETGWTLSTTRMAAHLMGTLRACALNPASDEVLEWLKSSPRFDPVIVSELEQVLRHAGEPQWSRFAMRHAAVLVASVSAAKSNPDLAPFLATVQALRAEMRDDRPLAQWLAGLRLAMQATGLWQVMEQDAAGQQAIRALRLAPHGVDEIARHGAAGQHWPLPAFVSWVDAVLEAHRFMPPYEADAQVVVLPIGQLLGRSFAALVMPGCDERQLGASPDPQGSWTVGQRTALGLPTRAEIEITQRLAWAQAIAAPGCQLLWHEKESGDEPVLPSQLLLELQLDGLVTTLPDPRQWQEFAFTPMFQARPQGERLAVTSVSASAYEDLRRCPYRFFALRQLGLRESDEIEEEIGKRDFGLWLHEVLRRFHESLPADAGVVQKEQLLERCAMAATRALYLDEAQFLPFWSVWPSMRSGYLKWLARRGAGGSRFESAERWLERDLVRFKLVGRIDRIDRMSDGGAMLIDYKTEDAQKSARRVAEPLEDVQLAFYAALLGEDQAAACYLNIGERGDVQERAHRHLEPARDALLDGMWTDLDRIRSGVPLPALGEGESCEHCAARGLCRKDFWSAS
jgi:ATP-dependent helicase/nuclease subunit B